MDVSQDCKAMLHIYVMVCNLQWVPGVRAWCACMVYMHAQQCRQPDAVNADTLAGGPKSTRYH